MIYVTLVVLYYLFSLCDAQISSLSLGIAAYDGNQIYAEEPVTLAPQVVCTTPCGAAIVFTFDFGDEVTPLVTTSASATHTYSAGGWYAIVLSAQDGSSLGNYTTSILVQPKRACYNFQVFTLVGGEERYAPTVTVGAQVTLYARVVDPSDTSAARSRSLTVLYDRLGELPSVTWDYQIPLPPVPFEVPLQVTFTQGVNGTAGVWYGVLSSSDDLRGYYPSHLTIPGRLTSRGVGVLGCSIRATPFSVTVARFSTNTLAPSPTPTKGATMLAHNYNPTNLRIARDPCSVGSGLVALGVSSTLGGTVGSLGGLVLTTDDAFGPTTTLVDLIGDSGEGPLCGAFPASDCSTITIYDIKFIPGGYIVLLTSRGLAKASSNSTTGYLFSSIPTGTSLVDDGFNSSTVSMFTSTTCHSNSEMTGPNYIYVVYTTTAATTTVLCGKLSDDDDDVSTDDAITWTSLDISDFATGGRSCVGVAWSSDTRTHTILLSGTSSLPPVVLACTTSCDIAFSFPQGTVLTGMTDHQAGVDLLVYGDSVWYSSLDNYLTFFKIADLEAGTAVSLTSSAQHAAYAVLTDQDSVYYGRVAVHDSVTIPSPLSLVEGSFLGTLLFDSLGHLYTLYIDTPSDYGSLSASQYPIGLYLNENGALHNFIDSSLLHKTQLLVAGTVSSSDLSPSCPLALQMEGKRAAVRPMQSGCRLDARSENRVLDLINGGSILLCQISANGAVGVGTITDTLIPLVISTLLANASVSIYPLNDGACGVSIVANQPGFTGGYVGRTLIYRLDSIYLITFVDATHMTGTSLACVDGANEILTQATTSSREVILNGAGIFTYPDGPTSDGLGGWLVPSGYWSLYDLSSPARYRITPQCSYLALAFAQGNSFATDTMDAIHPVVYLDVGDTGDAFAQVSPIDAELYVHLSGMEAVVIGVSSIGGYATMNGLVANNISFMLTEGAQKGGATLLLRPRIPSLACDMAGASLRIVHDCPPTKSLQFVRSYTLDQFLSDEIPTYSSSWPMLVKLDTNYRPPSHLGKAIPITDNMYNADPSKPRYHNTFRVSKTTGKYKQCAGKVNRSECGCTDEQRFYGLLKNSDCIDKVYSWSWREVFMPQLALEDNGVWVDAVVDFTVTELNGRTDYCFNETEIDCKSPGVNTYAVRSGSYIGIRFLGSELYHFRFTVVRFYNGTTNTYDLSSYCDLKTDIAVWAYNPPLNQTTAWLTVALTAVMTVMFLFAAFLLYSYLYSSDAT